jgi:hypothetical protein
MKAKPPANDNKSFILPMERFSIIQQRLLQLKRGALAEVIAKNALDSQCIPILKIRFVRWKEKSRLLAQSVAGKKIAFRWNKLCCKYEQPLVNAEGKII